MTFSGQKHGAKACPFDKYAILWTFKNIVFYSQKGFLFSLQSR